MPYFLPEKNLRRAVAIICSLGNRSALIEKSKFGAVWTDFECFLKFPVVISCEICVVNLSNFACYSAMISNIFPI